MSFQRPSYDKTGLGYFIGEKSTKKSKARKEPNPEIHQPMQDKEYLNKIESNQSDNLSKEVEQVKQLEKIEEPEQHDKIESPKEVR